MTPEQEAIIRKVQKLLALADNAGSEHEAQSAALRAREILREYDLSMSDVESVKQEECREVGYKLNVAYIPSHIKILSHAVCHQYSVQCVYMGDYDLETMLLRRKVTYIGIMPDVFIASQLLGFLDKYAQRMARQHGYKGKARTEYLGGFALAVYRRMRDAAKAQAPTEQESALVVVKNAVATDYMQRHYADARKSRACNVPDQTSASRRGRADGSTVSLDRPVEESNQQAVAASA